LNFHLQISQLATVSLLIFILAPIIIYLDILFGPRFSTYLNRIFSVDYKEYLIGKILSPKPTLMVQPFFSVSFIYVLSLLWFIRSKFLPYFYLLFLMKHYEMLKMYFHFLFKTSKWLICGMLIFSCTLHYLKFYTKTCILLKNFVNFFLSF
jgi:hypothetical protein